MEKCWQKSNQSAHEKNLAKRVETHGGNVDVKSKPGEGLEFLVRLPFA